MSCSGCEARDRQILSAYAQIIALRRSLVEMTDWALRNDDGERIPDENLNAALRFAAKKANEALANSDSAMPIADDAFTGIMSGDDMLAEKDPPDEDEILDAEPA